MKSFIFFIICLLFAAFSTKLTAQDEELQKRIKGLDRVEDIMNVVVQYFQEKKSEAQSNPQESEDYAEWEEEYTQWARWGLYMSARTDENGRLVDVDRFIRKAYDSYKNSERSSAANWVFRGPSSVTGSQGSATGIGRVNRVAFDPVNANIIYIGTPDGGLFKSTTDGANWTPMTDNIPSISVSGIVVSWADPNDIYILTGDGDGSHGGLETSSGYYRTSSGVYLSSDGGTNWRPTGDFPITDSYAGLNLAQSPTDAALLLAATTEGLFRTVNGGNVWTLVLDGETFEVKFKPGDGMVVYATQKGAFFRSSNGGQTFTEINNFVGDTLKAARVAMAVSLNFPEYVYLFDGWAPTEAVSACGSADHTFGGIFRSTDSGLNFTRRCNTPNLVESCCDGSNSRSQQGYDLALAVSHSNVSNLVSGGILAWRSSSGGVSWVNASGEECANESGSTGYIHPDIHDIEYNPLNGDVYLCNDGGIMKSTNNGLDWISLNLGVAASQAYHLAGSQVDLDNMMIGLQDNGVKRRNANTTVWDDIAGGDGYDCVYDWNSATTGFLSTNSVVKKFTGNGASTTEVTPVDSFFQRVTSGVNDPTLVIVGNADIYKSTNGGSSWSNKGASGYWDVERCPSNENRFYAAGGQSYFSTTGSMYFSSDKGDTWANVSGNPGYPTGLGVRMTDIDVRPTNSGYVWITFGGLSAGNKVFFSNTAGQDWDNMSGSLPNVPVNAIKVDANNNAYIGTDIGVFYRGANMTDWVPFWNHLPVIPVTDLELYEADGIIRASTFGRGVWESDTYSTCPQSVGITGNLNGNRFYEVSSSITSTNNIFGGANTKIIFKSANYIQLNPGFEAKKYNTVHAYIAPCGVAQLED